MKKLTIPVNFYNKVRASIFGGTISGNQLEGIEQILNACGEDNWNTSHTAYALATAFHETNRTMQPISEMGGVAYFTKLYDVKGNNPSRAIKNGNTEAGDGPKYKGRGFVQLTWKNNYAKASRKLGVDLVTNPEKAKDLDVASKILVVGMKEGWFRGVTCSSTMPRELATKEEFSKARGIINAPSDDPLLIASYAMNFQEALKSGNWK